MASSQQAASHRFPVAGDALSVQISEEIKGFRRGNDRYAHAIPREWLQYVCPGFAHVRIPAYKSFIQIKVGSALKAGEAVLLTKEASPQEIERCAKEVPISAEDLMRFEMHNGRQATEADRETMRRLTAEAQWRDKHPLIGIDEETRIAISNGNLKVFRIDPNVTIKKLLTEGIDSFEAWMTWRGHGMEEFRDQGYIKLCRTQRPTQTSLSPHGSLHIYAEPRGKVPARLYLLSGCLLRQALYTIAKESWEHIYAQRGRELPPGMSFDSK